MAEAKHTPGPWKVVPTGYTGRASAKYVIVPEYGARAVAHIKHSTVSPMQANARLIAEAPELLALLIESQHSIGTDWRARRDAAIAKATS
jgi:hypothetical protein